MTIRIADIPLPSQHFHRPSDASGDGYAEPAKVFGDAQKLIGEIEKGRGGPERMRSTPRRSHLGRSRDHRKDPALFRDGPPPNVAAKPGFLRRRRGG